ncbi:MAG TPA: class I SAM-dependent methyltransferase, partial [Tepidisphaeraceae bacterium]|nr:class I SAM-dependent methyltransferase [Tepidisphaeraceae bacterium]
HDSPAVESIRASYEETQYPGGAFTASHPDHLRVIAALGGFTATTSAANCRVLEIGCAIGRNLMPMAQSMPNSRFLGIDLSPRQIEIGQAVARQLGINNLELRCQDLLDFPADEGPFDYIIAHGVYSWVPPHVRERLLQICGRSLSPGGLAYISYNTLPGWHLLGALRDMMLFHSQGAKNGTDRAALSREMVKFASQPWPLWPAYRQLMNDEQKQMADRSDWYLLHEFVAPVNHPFHFLDFARDAAGHGLHHLGDALTTIDKSYLLTPEMQQQLRQFAEDDELKRQQYLDYLGGRAFRASVLCRADAPHTPARPAMALQQMYIAGRLTEEPAQDEATKTPIVRFSAADGGEFKLNLSDMGMIAAMGRISGAWPHAVQFAELLDLATMLSPPDPQQHDPALDLARMLLLAYRAGVVELWTGPTDFIATNLQRPHATALARHQVAMNEDLINLRHQYLRITPTIAAMVPLMDGARDRAALLRELTAMIDRRTLSLPGVDESAVATDSLLDTILTEFHLKSLLTGPLAQR